MTKIAIARNRIPLSVLSNRGRIVCPDIRSFCPDTEAGVDAVRDEDGLTAS